MAHWDAKFGRAPVAASFLLTAGAVGAGVMLLYPWWRHGGSIEAVMSGLALALAWAGLVYLLITARGAAMAALLVAVGVGLRITAASLMAGTSLANDPLSYSTLAQALLDGRGLIAWGLRAHYPPLYPILLALGSLLSS